MMRRVLIIAMVGLLAAGILTGYNVAFAQDITSDAEKLDQGANVIWMVGAFLVFFMQAGFAFLGAGLIRSKNTTNYMTKSFMDFAIASLSFWAFGFALMWGTSALGIAGTTNFFLTEAADGQTYVDWVFQMVFAGTAATIVAGAVAERTKTQAYLAYSFIIGGGNLSPVRSLGMGWWMVGQSRSHWTSGRRGLRRFGCGSRSGRLHSPCRSGSRGGPQRQVQCRRFGERTVRA